MKFFFFAILLLTTLLYIWNGKDQFNKKEWLAFLVKILLVFVGGFVLALTLVLMLKFFPGLGVSNMRSLSVMLPGSFITILFCKFFVVMLCTIFNWIMRFHERHNTRKNYLKLASLVTRFGPRMQILAKCMASFGAVMMLYGIWLANAA